MLRMTIVRVDGGLFYWWIYVQIPGYTSVLNGSGNCINQISKSPLNGVRQRARSGGLCRHFAPARARGNEGS